MPNVLYPHVRWCQEEEPLHWDKQETKKVCRKRQEDEEDREGLENIKKCMRVGQPDMCNIQLTRPWYLNES